MIGSILLLEEELCLVSTEFAALYLSDLSAAPADAVAIFMAK
jgi:hypothetical protein